MTTKKAVILLSGGLDSATITALAQQQGFACHALSFDYGQRHSSELQAAEHVAKTLAVAEHRIMEIPLGLFGGSALTDSKLTIPQDNLPDNNSSDGGQQAIPITYVPARNTIFLALALGWAEVLDAQDIFIGVNALDYSGYPDCRPEFIKSFEQTANLATRAGVEGDGFQIHTPLIQLTKAEIIQLGGELGVDYAQTVSCYQADEQGRACGHCDSCLLRAKGFAEAEISDPTRMQPV